VKRSPILLALLLIVSPHIANGQPTEPAKVISSSRGARDTQAVRANDFLNTLGAGTHLIQGIETPAAIVAGLRYTGIRNIREDATHDRSRYAALCSIHSATGAFVDELPIVDADSESIRDTQIEYEALAACGALLQAEGPNEPNNFPFKYLGKTCSTSGSFAPCARYMADEYAMVKGDPKLAKYAVVDLTEPGAEPDNTGLQFLTIPSGQDTLMPGGTNFADVANLHNYVMGNGQTAVTDNQAWNAESTPNNGPWDGLQGEYCDKTWAKHYKAAPMNQCVMPKMTTETGWPSIRISEEQQGKLMTNVYLSAAKLGWRKTFVYLLFDEPQAGNAGYGFCRQSNGSAGLQPKPLGIYTHNLTTILRDSTSDFGAGAVNYSIPNESSTVHDLLMQKSTGTYEIVVWDDRPVGEATDSVTLYLDTSYPSVTVYDITSGTKPVQKLSNTSSVPITLTDHALIVELRPEVAVSRTKRHPGIRPVLREARKQIRIPK
jgi:hypothetical protein